MKEFNGSDLDLSYRQVSIFNYGLENPFSDWTKKHIEQGFTYRPGSIGIMTFSQSGLLKTGVDFSEEVKSESERILVLPFNVSGNSGIEVATITAGFQVEIDDGEYSLMIQLGRLDESTDWIWFSFVQPTKLDSSPRFLKADLEITRRNDFLLSAYPA